MRSLALAALFLVSTQAFAVTAFWTGRSNYGTSVTGLMVLNCEYQYGGRVFWRAFQGSCASSVEVQ